MTSALKLLRCADPAAIVARRGSRDISAASFAADVAALARRLPANKRAANLCRDRYRFLVALAAVAARGGFCLLPASGAPHLLRDALDGESDLYVLADEATPVPSDYPVVQVDADGKLPELDALPEVDPDQTAAVLYTSGSTGRSEPHPRSWRSLLLSAQSVGQRFGFDACSGVTVISTVPHQHSYGLESGIALPLQHGGVIDTAHPFFPRDVFDRVEAAPHPRLLVTTPVHLRALVAHPGAAPRIDLLLSATAPLAAELAAEAERRFGAMLHEIYGCSEAGQVAMRQPVRTAQFTCLDGVEIRDDDGVMIAEGGFIDRPTPLGDVLDLDGARRFHLRGRVADLVNIAGKRSSLAYLTHHLLSVDGVEDAVFFAPEQDDHTARLVAFAVAPSMSVADLLAQLRQRIDPVFLPRPLHLVPHLPRNETGKLRREDLQHLSRVLEAE